MENMKKPMHAIQTYIDCKNLQFFVLKMIVGVTYTEKLQEDFQFYRMRIRQL